jgi:hypothetical protein
MGLGSGIRDPGSEKILSRIPVQGSKRHRITDPDPQHWLGGGGGGLVGLNWAGVLDDWTCLAAYFSPTSRLHFRQLCCARRPARSAGVPFQRCSPLSRQSISPFTVYLIFEKDGRQLLNYYLHCMRTRMKSGSGWSARLKKVARIRVGSRFNQVPGSGSSKAKRLPKTWKMK